MEARKYGNSISEMSKDMLNTQAVLNLQQSMGKYLGCIASMEDFSRIPNEILVRLLLRNVDKCCRKLETQGGYLGHVQGLAKGLHNWRKDMSKDRTSAGLEIQMQIEAFSRNECQLAHQSMVSIAELKKLEIEQAKQAAQKLQQLNKTIQELEENNGNRISEKDWNRVAAQLRQQKSLYDELNASRELIQTKKKALCIALGELAVQSRVIVQQIVSGMHTVPQSNLAALARTFKYFNENLKIVSDEQPQNSMINYSISLFIGNSTNLLISNHKRDFVCVYFCFLGNYFKLLKRDLQISQKQFFDEVVTSSSKMEENSFLVIQMIESSGQFISLLSLDFDEASKSLASLPAKFYKSIKGITGLEINSNMVSDMQVVIEAIGQASNAINQISKLLIGTSELLKQSVGYLRKQHKITFSAISRATEDFKKDKTEQIMTFSSLRECLSFIVGQFHSQTENELNKAEHRILCLMKDTSKISQDIEGFIQKLTKKTDKSKQSSQVEVLLATDKSFKFFHWEIKDEIEKMRNENGFSPVVFDATKLKNIVQQKGDSNVQRYFSKILRESKQEENTQINSQVIQKQASKKVNQQNAQRSCSSDESFRSLEGADDAGNGPQKISTNDRQKRIEEAILRNSPFTYQLIDTELKGPGITTNNVFYAVFSDAPYFDPTNGKQSQNFFIQYIENTLKCWNVKATPWTPIPPRYFQNANELTEQDEDDEISEPIECTRTVEYFKTVPLKGIPFLPKHCTVSEKQRIVFVSKTQMMFEIEASSSGVPLADSFFHIVRSTFKQKGNDSVDYKIEMNVRFTQSTIFSGTIGTQSQKEGIISSRISYECFQERMTKYLEKESQNKRKQKTENKRNDISSTPNQSKNIKMQDIIREREERISKELEDPNIYKYQILDMQLSSGQSGTISVSEVFTLLFSLEGYAKMKKEVLKNTQYIDAVFVPEMPKFLEIGASEEDIADTIEDSADWSDREIHFTQPLPPSSIPFMPKQCKVREVLRSFWISPSLIILNVEAFTTGIPKGDSFTVRVRYWLRQVSENSVSIEQKTYVRFSESTILQSTIENATIEQQKLKSTSVVDHYKQQFSLYLQQRQVQQPKMKEEEDKSKKQKGEKHMKEDHKEADLIRKREEKILQILGESAVSLKHIILSEEFTVQDDDYDFLEAVKFLVGDTIPYQQRPSFSEYLKTDCFHNTGYECTKLTPELPSSDIHCLDWPICCSKVAMLTQAFKESKIPFMPKNCLMKETVKIYLLNPHKAILAAEVYSSGFPKSDYFKVVARVLIEKTQKNKVAVEHSIDVVFLKSTIFSSQIVSGILKKQNAISKKILFPEYTKAVGTIRNVQKKHRKQTENGQTEATPILNNLEMVKVKQNQQAQSTAIPAQETAPIKGESTTQAVLIAIVCALLFILAHSLVISNK